MATVISDNVTWCVMVWQDSNGVFYAVDCDGPIHFEADTNWNPVEGADPSSLFTPRTKAGCRVQIQSPGVREFQRRNGIQGLIDTAQRMLNQRRL